MIALALAASISVAPFYYTTPARDANGAPETRLASVRLYAAPRLTGSRALVRVKAEPALGGARDTISSPANPKLWHWIAFVDSAGNEGPASNPARRIVPTPTLLPRLSLLSALVLGLALVAR